MVLHYPNPSLHGNGNTYQVNAEKIGYHFLNPEIALANETSTHPH